MPEDAPGRVVPSHPGLALRWPRVDEEGEFLRAHQATSPSYPTFLHHYDEGMPFDAYLRRLQEQSRGIGLPSPQHVPASFLFAFDGARIVGRVSIRHRLAPQRGHLDGHVGYAVVPEFRGHGYATALLGRAIEIARGTLGIQRILVTCDADHVASMKVIERNGGVLEDIAVDPRLIKPKRRYWIG